MKQLVVVLLAGGLGVLEISKLFVDAFAELPTGALEKVVTAFATSSSTADATYTIQREFNTAEPNAYRPALLEVLGVGNRAAAFSKPPLLQSTIVWSTAPFRTV